MASPREVRRLAFQVLFQLEAQSTEQPSAKPAKSAGPRPPIQSASASGSAPTGTNLDQWIASTEYAEGFTSKERSAALTLARAAFADRATADKELTKLAPDWPTHRQAAVDRAILRLAHYEMTSGTAPPKAALSDAVELAKLFSTEKSPGFINALLDNVLRRIHAERHGEHPDHLDALANEHGGEPVPTPHAAPATPDAPSAPGPVAVQEPTITPPPAV